jgi:flagellar biosynthesis chaperone FliJ
MNRTLHTLLRLRRFEADAARRALAEALAAEAAAEAGRDQAAAALCEEAKNTDADTLLALQNFAAWLPRGTADRQAANHALAVAAKASAAARAALAERRAALEAVEKRIEAQARADQQEAARREAHALDEAFRAIRSGE